MGSRGTGGRKPPTSLTPEQAVKRLRMVLQALETTAPATAGAIRRLLDAYAEQSAQIARLKRRIRALETGKAVGGVWDGADDEPVLPPLPERPWWRRIGRRLPSLPSVPPPLPPRRYPDYGDSFTWWTEYRVMEPPREQPREQPRSEEYRKERKNRGTEEAGQ